MAEPGLRRRRRLTGHCSRCAKRFTRGKPEWTTCLECEIHPEWTLVTTAEFFAKAKRVFPGSVELPLPDSPGRDRGEPDHDHGDDDDLGQMELAA
jgi:hypothetical protein